MSEVGRVLTKLLSWFFQEADEGLVSDMYGNFMSSLGNRSGNASHSMAARRVSTFSPDLTGPSLLSWDLRKDESRIRLYFDEPVNVSAGTVAGITIQVSHARYSGQARCHKQPVVTSVLRDIAYSDYTCQSVTHVLSLLLCPQGFSTRLNFPSYTLTRASSSAAISNVTDDSTVVDVTIGAADMAQIHARRARMGSMHTNSFLLLSRYAVTDTSGNRNTVRHVSNNRQGCG